jgi:hypothetical protein
VCFPLCVMSMEPGGEERTGNLATHPSVKKAHPSDNSFLQRVLETSSCGCFLCFSDVVNSKFSQSCKWHYSPYSIMWESEFWRWQNTLDVKWSSEEHLARGRQSRTNSKVGHSTEKLVLVKHTN